MGSHYRKPPTLSPHSHISTHTTTDSKIIMRLTLVETCLFSIVAASPLSVAPKGHEWIPAHPGQSESLPDVTQRDGLAT